MPRHPDRARGDDRGEPGAADRDEGPEARAAHDGSDDGEGEGDEGRPGFGGDEQVQGGERGDDGDRRPRESARGEKGEGGCRGQRETRGRRGGGRAGPRRDRDGSADLDQEGEGDREVQREPGRRSESGLALDRVGPRHADEPTPGFAERRLSRGVLAPTPAGVGASARCALRGSRTPRRARAMPVLRSSTNDRFSAAISPSRHIRNSGCRRRRRARRGWCSDFWSRRTGSGSWRTTSRAHPRVVP